MSFDKIMANDELHIIENENSVLDNINLSAHDPTSNQPPAPSADISAAASLQKMTTEKFDKHNFHHTEQYVNDVAAAGAGGQQP